MAARRPLRRLAAAAAVAATSLLAGVTAAARHPAHGEIAPATPTLLAAPSARPSRARPRAGRAVTSGRRAALLLVVLATALRSAD